MARRSRSRRLPSPGGIAHRAVLRIQPYADGGAPGYKARRRHYERLAYVHAPEQPRQMRRFRRAAMFMVPTVATSARGNPSRAMVERLFPPAAFVSRVRSLTCRQKSQRPTDRKAFSSGGGSRQNWAIARKQRERKCR